MDNVGAFSQTSARPRFPHRSGYIPNQIFFAHANAPVRLCALRIVYSALLHFTHIRMVNNECFTIDFPGRDPRECFQLYFRQHWIRLLWPFFRTTLLSISLIGIGILTFAVTIDDPWLRRTNILFIFACFFVAQCDFLLRFYRYFLNLTIVTDRRVHRIKRSLISIDEHQSIDVWAIQDIRGLQRGIIQNIFGFGTLLLEAQDTKMNIHFTPRIAEHSKKLTALLEQSRVQRREEQQGM
jgi:hypothetical protein